LKDQSVVEWEKLCNRFYEKNWCYETICWNEALDKHLKNMGFEQANSDPCTYTASGGELFVIAVYVDDIILAGRSDKRMREVKNTIAAKIHIQRCR